MRIFAITQKKKKTYIIFLISSFFFNLIFIHPIFKKTLRVNKNFSHYPKKKKNLYYFPHFLSFFFFFFPFFLSFFCPTALSVNLKANVGKKIYAKKKKRILYPIKD